MKNEVKVFFSGIIAGLVAVIAFFLGRKKGVADMGGIRSDSQQYDDSSERVDTVSGRVGTAQDAITDSIRILENARKRAEENNNQE